MPTPVRPSRFTRVLLKLSGESFCSPAGSGVEARELGLIAAEVAHAVKAGAQVAVVVGGGNLIRGAELAAEGVVEQAVADQMGMLGTIVNGIALRERLQGIGVAARVMSAVAIQGVVDPFVRARAIEHLERGEVVVLAGGIGHPFFTTDTTAALRAAELACDVVLKATKVDGVYSADPKKDPKATRFTSISFDEALARKLKIMDATALALCQERRLPVLVFDFGVAGNIGRVVKGEPIGTFVHA